MREFAMNKKAVIVLLVVGFLFFLGGLSNINDFNAAATLVGAACFLGIVARIIQAEMHHDDDVEAREKQP